MRPSNFLNTATFRLALSYASLFAVSSIVVFGIVYWAIQEFESQLIRKSIAAEVGSLELSSKSGSPDSLAKTIQDRTQFPGHHLFEYALVDAHGGIVAGNLASPPQRLGWQSLTVTGPTLPDGDSSGVIYVLGTELAGGQRLFVAQDTESLEELRETVASTFALGSAITIILAIVGGATISGLFVRRIERINRTARSIMAGAIGERMPLRGTNDEFDRLSVNLNLMLDRIELLMGNLKRVSSDIAHDLRTPLTHLRHGLEQAKSSARSVPEFEVAIEGSLEQTDGILRLFGALLRIAEIESGEQRALFAGVDFSKLASKLLETYTPVAEDDGYGLTGIIEPGLIVRGDHALLTQMIANLCENAMRHTPAGSNIVICLTASDRDIVCTVADDGPGVPELERERIFRPFYRLDQSRSTPGSGLGLALVKAIAELHDGHVSLKNAGRGAKFEVRLPAHASDKAVAKPAVPGSVAIDVLLSGHLPANR